MLHSFLLVCVYSNREARTSRKLRKPHFATDLLLSFFCYMCNLRLLFYQYQHSRLLLPFRHLCYCTSSEVSDFYRVSFSGPFVAASETREPSRSHCHRSELSPCHEAPLVDQRP